MTLNQLRKLNKHVKIKGITNKAFIKYGKIVTAYDFSGVISYIENKTPVPEEGMLCVNYVDNIEIIEEATKLKHNFFGEMDIQIGYINGANYNLNFMQYNKTNQILIAVTDIIIFVGKVQDIKEEQYDSSKAEIFFVPSGVAIELYSTTLLSPPCNMEEGGYRAVSIQLRGTGSSLKIENKDQKFLHSKNKWIIAHEEALDCIDYNMQAGIIGENIEIRVMA